MTGKKHISGLFFFLSLFVSVTLATIGGVNAQNSDIVTNVEQKSGVKLPIGYTEKIRNFTMNNKVLKKETAANFTEDFIIKEMKTDRGISRENKLLFIYCAIGYNYNQDFYTGDDGDNNRMSEFEEVMDTIENCQARYKNEFISYMQQRSAEADRRSAEALTSSLENLIRFYNRYKKDPSTIKDEELTRRKEDGKRVIQGCKELGIDYKAKLSPEMLKFYGVE